MSKLTFRIKRTPTKYDIPIASLQVQPIDASNVLRIDDFSDCMTENIVDINSIITSSVQTGSTFSTLDVSAPDTELLLTDKTYLDEQKGKSYPLWYLHTVSAAYYNKAFTTKTIKRRIRPDYFDSDRIFTYLTDSSSKVIVRNSVVVTRTVSKNSAKETLSKNDFVVDFTARKLTVSKAAAYADDNQTLPVYEIDITYSVLNLDVLIYPSDASAKYIVEVYQPTSSAGYFVLEIFSDSPSPMNVIYKYADKNGEIQEMNEYTLSCPIFRKVSHSLFESLLSREDVSDLFRRMFSLTEKSSTGIEYNINVSSLNPLATYYFTSSRTVGTKIHTDLPFSRKYDNHWHLSIPTSKFIAYSGGEKLTYSFSSDETIVGITERVSVIGSNRISLNYKNPIVSRTIGGGYSGIKIMRNKQQIKITSIDISNGIVCLDTDVSRKEIITASYRVKRSGTEITSMCFNPMPCHAYHNYSCKKQVYGIFILPEEYAPTRRVLICEFPKYRNTRQIDYTYETVDAMINSPEPSQRNRYRETMNIPSDVTVDLLSTTLYRIELISLVYLSNPLDEDGFAINDVRTYGGGYIKPGYSCHDYSTFDGEIVDLAARLHYTVPRWIYTDLRNRALEYDEDIAHLADKESRVDGLLSEKLTALFKKYSQPGTEITYEVVDNG